MMRAGPRTPIVVARVALLLMAISTVELLAQAMTVHRVGEALAVRAPTFTFIKGEPLVRLKDGRSLRVDLELSALPGPGGAAATQGRQVFILSYDLWEERFAVTQVGVPSRSIANRTAGEVEGWCLEQLTVPIASLGIARRRSAVLDSARVPRARRRQRVQRGRRRGIHAARADRRAQPPAEGHCLDAHGRSRPLPSGILIGEAARSLE